MSLGRAAGLVALSFCINEAVDLGKKYGTDDSGSFINGILDYIVSEIGKEGIPEPATLS